MTSGRRPMTASARLALAAAVVGLVAFGAILLGDDLHAPPRTAPVAATEDWRRAAASLELVAEEYAEDTEIDGRLDQRRPAMVRRMDETVALVRAARPPSPALAAAVSGLRDKVAGPVDYLLPQAIQNAVADVEKHAGYARVPAVAPSLDRGRIVYRQACAPCHGVKADGDSPVSKALDPPPANLLHAEHDWRPYDMYARVTYGGLETGMPGFEQGLSAEDRWDVVFYLFSERWPACDHDTRPLTSSVLALASDFDLAKRVRYADMACARRRFVGP